MKYFILIFVVMFTVVLFSAFANSGDKSNSERTTTSTYYTLSLLSSGKIFQNAGIFPDSFEVFWGNHNLSLTQNNSVGNPSPSVSFSGSGHDVSKGYKLGTIASDLIFQADVMFTNASTAEGIYVGFRGADDTSNGYAAKYGPYYGGILVLAKNVGGIGSEIVPPVYGLPSSINTWYNMEVRAIESSLQVYFDHTLQIDALDTSILSGYPSLTFGTCCSDSNTWYIDNIKIFKSYQITINNLQAGQKIELYNAGGNLKTSDTVATGQISVNLDVSSLSFPFVGYFKVYDAVGTLIYTSDSYTGIWGGDIYSFQSQSLAVPTKITFHSNRDGNYEIYLMNPDGTGLQRLTYNDSVDGSPSWSPDGNKIAFSSNRDGNYEIYVMKSDGTNQTRLTNNTVEDNTPSWSPDGSKIVFTSGTYPNVDIYVMNSDGTNRQQLTYDGVNAGSARFSPDGTKILFASWRSSGICYLWIMDSDGSNIVQVPNTMGWVDEPNWSPDGIKIVYTGWGDIFVINADGTNPINLTNNDNYPTVNNSNPYFSPDGNKISFISSRDGNWEIYTMNADGANQTRLTNNSVNDGSPAWSPFLTTPLLESPQITSVKDVPNDQGGKVTLRWIASALDTNLSTIPFYSIWRAMPEGMQAIEKIVAQQNIKENFVGPAYRTENINGVTQTWEWIANQPAHRFTEYSYTAATLYDSMSTIDGKHYFLVSAHTNDPNVFYDSNIDSGYSVDNLAPLAPKHFTGSFISGEDRLNWSPNPETDLKEYVIYRGTSPTDQTLFATTRDTFYINNNPQVGNSYWWIRATDIHDNLSDYSSLVVTDIKETGMIPITFSLSQNFPNPFNPSTNIKYALPKVSHVSLSVFNTLGQRVAMLVDDKQEAGYHEVNFNASGLTSGVYFYRLQAGDPSTSSGQQFIETKKLILMK